MLLKRILFPILFILLLVSILINYSYLKEVQRHNYNYGVFLNQIYSELGQSIASLDKLTEQDLTKKELEKNLIQLSNNLSILNHSLQNSALFIDGVNHQGVTLIKQMNETITNGNKLNDLYIPKFAKDKQLSRNELSLLNTFKDHLSKVRNLLRSKESGQEDQSIQKNRLNEILNMLSFTEYPVIVKTY